MSQQIKEVEYRKLRESYLTVQHFLEEETMEKVGSLKVKLDQDLGCYGLDNSELLDKFIEKYDLNYDDFEYDKYFQSEGELCAPNLILSNLFILIIRLPLRIIELVTFNKMRLNKPNYFKIDRDVLDLSFKDLITWYIEGAFTTEKEIKYRIITPHNKPS